MLGVTVEVSDNNDDEDGEENYEVDEDDDEVDEDEDEVDEDGIDEGENVEEIDIDEDKVDEEDETDVFGENAKEGGAKLILLSDTV